MSAATESQQPIPHSTLRRLVANHPVVAFLIMVYTFAWTILFAAFQLGWPLQLASSLGVIFGLALPAFLVTAATSGRAGMRDLLSRCLRWRVGIHWYLLTLLGLLIVTLLVASAFLGVAPLEAFIQKWPLFFTMFVPEILTAVLLIQLSEEAAWTGFMQDTLQQRHGPLLASLLVAPAFALFHLPFNLAESPMIEALVQLIPLAVFAIFFRVVIMWLYNGAGRSVLIVALFHSAFNSATGSGDMRYISEVISGPEAQFIPLAVVAAVAVLGAVLTRGRLAYRSRGATLPPLRPSVSSW